MTNKVTSQLVEIFGREIVVEAVATIIQRSIQPPEAGVDEVQSATANVEKATRRLKKGWVKMSREERIAVLTSERAAGRSIPDIAKSYGAKAASVHSFIYANKLKNKLSLKNAEKTLVMSANEASNHQFN